MRLTEREKGILRVMSIIRPVNLEACRSVVRLLRTGCSRKGCTAPRPHDH